MSVRLLEFLAAYTCLSSGCEHCGVIGLSPGESKTKSPVQRLKKHLKFQRCRMLSHLLRPQIEADAAHHGAERVARSIKPPILARSWFWNSMTALSLDWRSPERMVVTLPPREAASAATTLVSGLFNAAHKSIQENQHETFWSSLVALSFIVEAYVKRRGQYLGSTDQLLAYLNDQLAALAKAAAKSPNEYMVMNTVTTIGAI